jgi:hypothetical protein
MEVRETLYDTEALNFKTPAKRKLGSDGTLSPAPLLLDLSVYSPFFKDDEVAPITDVDHVSGVLAHLDGGITANNAAIINSIDDYKASMARQPGDSIWSMWLCLEALTSTVGRLPACVRLSVPSTWASIGALAGKLEEIKKSQTTQGIRLEDYESETTLTMQQQVKLSRKDFDQRLDSFKTAFISATRELGGPSDKVDGKLIGMVDNSPMHGSLQERQEPRGNSTALFGQCTTANPLPEAFTGGRTQNEAILLDESNTGLKVARVEHRVDLMEQKVHLLIAKSYECDIWFAGLGFQSSSDSNALLKKELQNHQSGLIVGAHMVLENV